MSRVPTRSCMGPNVAYGCEGPLTLHGLDPGLASDSTARKMDSPKQVVGLGTASCDGSCREVPELESLGAPLSVVTA